MSLRALIVVIFVLAGIPSLQVMNYEKLKKQAIGERVETKSEVLAGMGCRMKDNDVKQKDIENVVTSLFDAFEQEDLRFFEQLAPPESVDVNTPEMFYLSFKFKIEQYGRQLLKSKLKTSNDDLLWLYEHANFVEHQFLSLIKIIEGRICSVDKSRHIITSLAEFFKDGTLIDTEPKEKRYWISRVFNSHNRILEYYNGIVKLYYGDPSPLLKTRHEIAIE